MDAQLCEQRVDRTHLNSLAPTGIAQGRGLDVIAAVGHQERQCRKPLNETVSRLWPGDNYEGESPTHGSRHSPFRLSPFLVNRLPNPSFDVSTDAYSGGLEAQGGPTR